MLHLATASNNLEFTFLAVAELGLSVSTADGKGQTPLQLAEANLRSRGAQFQALVDFLRTAEQFQKVPTVDFAELKLERELASGQFGVVWLATWHSTQVVVKLLKRASADWTPEQFAEFANESVASDRVSKHPNIGESCFWNSALIAFESSLRGHLPATAEPRNGGKKSNLCSQSPFAGLSIYDRGQPRGESRQAANCQEVRTWSLLHRHC